MTDSPNAFILMDIRNLTFFMISFISSLYLPHAVMDAHDRSDKSFLYHKKEEYPMANVYDKLKEMNLTLPTPPAKGGLYTPVMEFGDHLLFALCAGDLGGPAADGLVEPF